MKVCLQSNFTARNSLQFDDFFEKSQNVTKAEKIRESLLTILLNDAELTSI